VRNGARSLCEVKNMGLKRRKKVPRIARILVFPIVVALIMLYLALTREEEYEWE
jgi:hypothetical protein